MTKIKYFLNRMISQKFCWGIAFFCISSAVYANLRAPVHIDRNHSELRGEKNSGLKVLSEILEFHCPEAYKGKADFDAFKSRACDARIRYKIAGAAGKTKLIFVFSGFGDVSWRYGEKWVKRQSRLMKNADRKICSFCPDDMKNVILSEHEVELTEGESELEIIYKQALSYSESGHGYFSDGVWRQGFTYELWPIAEWQWAENFSAELKFSISARSGFLGIGYKDDRMACVIEENGKETPIQLGVAPVTDDRRRATARIELTKKPQRLRCSYTAD